MVRAGRPRPRSAAPPDPGGGWPQGTRTNLLLLLAVVAVFCWKVPLHATQMVWGSDLVRLDSAYKVVEHRSLWAYGRPALWDPTAFGGMSRTGDQGPGLFSPVGALLALTTAPQAFGWAYLVQLVAGTWGMFLFARRKGCEPLGALFAAVAFGFGGRVAGHLFAGHVGMVPAALALPWMLWALEVFFARRDLFGVLLLGTVTAAGALNGPSVQLVYYDGLFIGVCATWRIALDALSARAWRQAAADGLRTALAGLIFLAASSAWWFPVVRQTLLLSARAAGTDYAFSTVGSAAPTELLRLLWPFLGYPVPQPFVSDSSLGFFWATSLFVGVSALGLALGGLWLLRGRRDLWCYLLLAFLAVSLAAGSHSALHHLAYRFLPGFSLFRVPGRLLLYLDLVLALYAGLVLSTAQRGGQRWFLVLLLAGLVEALLAGTIVLAHLPQRPATGLWMPLVVVLVAGTVTVLWALRQVRTATWRRLWLALLTVELFLHWQPHVQMVEPEQVFPPLRVATYLAGLGEQGPFRIYDESGLLEQHLACRHGLEVLTGYRAGVYRHFLESYTRIWEHDRSDATEVELHPVAESACPTLLDLWNVRYVVSTRPDLPGDYDRVFVSPPGETRTQRYVYRRESALPRAYLVPDAQVPARGSLLAGLCAMDPRALCLVEESPLDGTADYQALVPEYRGLGDLTLRFTASGAGVVVLSQSWHPDLRAFDNGARVPVRRVNHAQAGVPVRAGPHVLRLVYHPWDFYLGCLLSGGTWLACLPLLVLLRRPGARGGRARSLRNAP